jgi:hypothetical protein
MLTIVLITFWAVSAGFVTAGLFYSFYQLITNSPVSFNLLMVGKLLNSVMAVPLLLFSGPMVIASHAAGRVAAKREWGWVLASAAIVTTWSFLTGVIILDFAFSLLG